MVLEQAEPWTPEAVADTTGVPAATVVELVKDYSTNKPSMIVNNMGSFQRTQYGTQAVGAQYYLALLTGNIGKAGTGICDAGGVTQMAKFGSAFPPPPNKPKKVAPIPTAKLANTFWQANRTRSISGTHRHAELSDSGRMQIRLSRQ